MNLSLPEPWPRGPCCLEAFSVPQSQPLCRKPMAHPSYFTFRGDASPMYSNSGWALVSSQILQNCLVDLGIEESQGWAEWKYFNCTFSIGHACTLYKQCWQVNWVFHFVLCGGLAQLSEVSSPKYWVTCFSTTNKLFTDCLSDSNYKNKAFWYM